MISSSDHTGAARLNDVWSPLLRVNRGNSFGFLHGKRCIQSKLREGDSREIVEMLARGWHTTLDGQSTGQQTVANAVRDRAVEKIAPGRARHDDIFNNEGSIASKQQGRRSVHIALG